MSSEARKTRNAFYARPWDGKKRHYDILKEGAIALVVVGVLTVVFAALFSSPDDAAITFKQWAGDSPDSFYATVVSQLAGSSETAGYGPPYNTNSDGLSIGPLATQSWQGVAHPVDTAQDFVILPLESQADPNPAKAALDAACAAHNATMQCFERRLDGPQDKGISQTHLSEGLVDDPLIQGVEVDDQIGQFRHAHIVACLVQMFTERVNRTIGRAGSSNTVCG